MDTVNSHLLKKNPLAAKTFLERTKPNNIFAGSSEEACAYFEAKFVSVKLTFGGESGDASFCQFKDGSLIEAFTLADGTPMHPKLVGLLKLKK